jgi:hypothetical protein
MILFVCDNASADPMPDGLVAQRLLVVNEATLQEMVLYEDVNYPGDDPESLTLFEFSKQHGGPAWTPGDLDVSFVGTRWVYNATLEDYVVDQAGLWTLPVQFDANGAIVGTVGTPVLAVACDYIVSDSGTVMPDIRQPYVWSPDGTRVVIRHADEILPSGEHVARIYVHDLLTLDPPFRLDGMGWFFDWSPDGSRILFRAGVTSGLPAGIYTMRPDGTDTTQVISPGKFEEIPAAVYSPDGSWYAYTVQNTKKHTRSVRIATLDGEGETTLVESNASVHGWAE